MPNSESGDADGIKDSKTVTVSKTAKRSPWLIGLSIVLVLYVHTTLAPVLTERRIETVKSYQALGNQF